MMTDDDDYFMIIEGASCSCHVTQYKARSHKVRIHTYCISYFHEFIIINILHRISIIACMRNEIRIMKQYKPRCVLVLSIGILFR